MVAAWTALWNAPMRLKAKGDDGRGSKGDFDRTEMMFSSAIRVSLFSVKSGI